MNNLIKMFLFQDQSSGIASTKCSQFISKVSRFASALFLSIAASGCQSENRASSLPIAAVPVPAVIGGDVDAHGCKGSAGYSWCARDAACIRPWELASQRGFKLGTAEVERYCLSGAK